MLRRLSPADGYCCSFTARQILVFHTRSSSSSSSRSRSRSRSSSSSSSRRRRRRRRSSSSCCCCTSTSMSGAIIVLLIIITRSKSTSSSKSTSTKEIQNRKPDRTICILGLYRDNENTMETTIMGLYRAWDLDIVATNDHYQHVPTLPFPSHTG